MKVQITQTNLNRALAVLSRVASNRTPLPILANILFKASKNSLELSATNLEVAITHTASSKIEEEGAVTIPARLLYDFVSQLPKDLTISLSFEGTKLTISAGSFSSHIQGASADDFPALPEIKKPYIVTITTQNLKSVLDKTILAASNDDTRPVLGGVYFHTEEGRLLAAATDGYRLAEGTLAKSDQDISAIVPVASLQDALRMVQDDSTNAIELKFEEGQFGVRADTFNMVSRLIDGQYPQYRQLIPENSDIQVTLKRAEFLTAAKLAGLFARETGGSITIKASEKDQTLAIGSVASQVGDNNSAITAEVSGSGDVVLNVKYLTDALNCFESDMINFRFSGSISPCVLTAKDQPGYQHIVMPLKS